MTPLVDDAGRLLEFAGVTRDIRERKVYEAQLHQAREAAETANRALQSANGELQRLATTDRLTGTWNRAYFDEVAAQETAREARYGEPLSLLLFDVDHFKAINDTHGHLVGDQVLIELTRRVRDQLRAIDVLARWGARNSSSCCHIAGRRRPSRWRKNGAPWPSTYRSRPGITCGTSGLRPCSPHSHHPLARPGRAGAKFRIAAAKSSIASPDQPLRYPATADPHRGCIPRHQPSSAGNGREDTSPPAA